MINSFSTFLISLAVHIFLFFAIINYIPEKGKKKELIILNMDMVDKITKIKKTVEKKQEITTKKKVRQIEKKAIQNKVESKTKKVVKEIKKIKKKEPIEKKVPKKVEEKKVVKQEIKPLKDPFEKEPIIQKKVDESIKRVKSADDYQEKYIKTNLANIISAIKKYKNYPYIAKKQGFEGKVIISCIIDIDAKIKEIKIIKASRFEILNTNSINILKLASKEFKAPKREVKLTIPFNYYLN